MAGIFISYRREDASGWTGRLAVDLHRAFPAHEVFHDIAAIRMGADFHEAIRESLASCVAMIVVIGPGWLRATDDAGNRRLDDPKDYVHLEVAESLQRKGLLVVPVLVGGVSMPKPSDLPEPLTPLARRNAHEISDKRWDYDVGQLVNALQSVQILAGPPIGAAAAETSAVRVADTSAQDRAMATPAEMPRGTVFRDGDDCPNMVVVPAGHYTMGSLEGEIGREEDEGPQHKVTIARPFAVGKYEITFDEWDVCVAAGGSAHKPHAEGWGRGRQPVVNVSWDDVRAYIAWLSGRTGKRYRLLSEAEWEYAARAGTSTRYPWGNEPEPGRANIRVSRLAWSNGPAQVGSFEANAFGLHDIIGNVWEWVQDCWNESYEGAPADARAWETGDCSRRVVRGGSWLEIPISIRVASRSKRKRGARSGACGFRVARDL